MNPCNWWCNSNNYDRYILNDSAMFGVPDPMLIKALIGLESAFGTNATSRVSNAICGGGTDYGLMQINPQCNNVSQSQLFNASYNLYWGIKYWANDYLYMQGKWGSSCNSSILEAGVLELYNGGSNYIGNTCGSFPKGLNYVGLVSKLYYPFCQNANYTPILQRLNDTSSQSND
jgi:soluble lytic murein transglycosylase-like protein